MTARVLTQRELNRALLARQLLLRRARLSLPRAVERLGALQAQWPPSPYVALWSRIEGFRQEQLMRALERRTLVKATLMRTTLHLVSARDYLSYAGLVRGGALRARERRAVREGFREDVERHVPRVLELTSAAPRSRPEILAALGLPKLRTDDRRGWMVWHLLAARAELVHSPESSVWRWNTAGAKFAPAPAWLGRVAGNGDEAATHLVRRYLAAFGPATRADLAQWTGLAVSVLEPGLSRLLLRRFRDEHGRELIDLPRLPLPPGDTPAPIRFLPMWDSVLLAHDDRSRILPDEYRRTVIANNGDVRQTFLVDGFVAGTWKLEGGRVQVEPFERLPTGVARELEREAARLAAFSG
jgi:hypothetical protein